MAKKENSIENGSPDPGMTEEGAAAFEALPPAEGAPQAGKVSEPKGSYVVTTRFVLEENWGKYYEVGEDVSHFEPKRLEILIAQHVVRHVAS